MPTTPYIQPEDDSLFTVKHKSKAVGRSMRHWFECSRCGYTFHKLGDVRYPVPIPPVCPQCGRRFVYTGTARGLYSLDER